jgi:hypothetical protein
MFRSVTGDEFRQALADSPASPLFWETFERFVSFDAKMNQSAAVHDGPLKVADSLTVPALCTLITGGLEVGGVLDLQNEWDGGGLFIVTGNVCCQHFISDYACCSFIDGDLDATQSLINGYFDSSLTVMGTLSTRLFIGADIWAEVGAGAVMDYGAGYCLPIGYSVAGAEAIVPRHSEEETLRLVLPAPNPKGYLLRAEQFDDLIRAGQPIFRK